MQSQRVAGFGELADAFDAIILDQFGVLHDGREAYRDASACLGQLAAAGKRLMVLSNSGRRAAQNAATLDRLGLPLHLIEGVITSGEVCWNALRDRADAFHRALGRRCRLLAEPRDAGFVHELDYTVVQDADDADFLLAVTVGTTLSVDACEPALQAGVRRGLPLLCANNDLVRPAGAGLLLDAPGALARGYAERGGTVHAYGKPLRAIFDYCLGRLDGVARERVVMVGDSLDHDIAGARNAGIASVYIAGGIGAGGHGAVDAPAGHAVDARAAQPDYVMDVLRW
jgi:HAD superfamily hydrolase (TIGR01459 family)